MRLLNCIEAGVLTATTLQTLLTGTQANICKAELAAALAIRGNFRRLMASADSIAALTGSAAAMTVIMGSKILRDTFITLMDNAAGAATLAANFIGNATYRASLLSTPEGAAMAISSANIRRAIWATDAVLTDFAGQMGINAMRESSLSRVIPITLTSANVAVRANTPSDGIMIGWSITPATTLTTTGRRSGSTVGATSVASGAATGTKAEFDNVMALQYNATSHPMFTSGAASRTAYIAFLPTPAV